MSKDFIEVGAGASGVICWKNKKAEWWIFTTPSEIQVAEAIGFKEMREKWEKLMKRGQ